MVRDRATWLSYVQMGLFGYFLYAFGPSIALLRDDHGYTRTVASLHGTAMAVGSITVGLLGAGVVRRRARLAARCRGGNSGRPCAPDRFKREMRNGRLA